MTTDPSTTETVEDPQDGPQTAQEQPDDTQAAPEAADAPQDTPDPDTDEPASHEAKRYRLKLRDTEAERDALASRLEALQRAEVERIAGQTVTKPAGIWHSGIAVEDLLNEAGDIDTDKVKAATITAAETLGLSRPVGPNYVPSEGGNSRPAPIDAMESVIRGN